MSTNNLKALREAKGYSQSQLARLSGLNVQTISKFERDARPLSGSSVSKMIKLADVLDVRDIRDFFTEPLHEESIDHIKENLLSFFYKRHFPKEMIRQIEKGEFSEGELVTLLLILDSANSPEYSAAQVAMFIQPAFGVNEMDSVERMLKRGMLEHTDNNQDKYTGEITDERAGIAAYSGMTGMALDRICQIAADPDIGNRTLRILANPEYSDYKLKTLFSLLSNPEVSAQTFFFFCDHDLTAFQEEEAWRQISKENRSVYNLDWTLIYDATEPKIDLKKPFHFNPGDSELTRPGEAFPIE